VITKAFSTLPWPWRLCQSTLNRTDRYPMIKLPVTLIRNVPSGNSPCGRACDAGLSPYQFTRFSS
jgi:hypothetical protein